MGKTLIKKQVVAAKRRFVEDIKAMVAVVEKDSGSHDSSFRSIQTSSVGIQSVVRYFNKTVEHSVDMLVEQVHSACGLVGKTEELEAILLNHLHIPRLRIGRRCFIVEVVEYGGHVCKTEMQTIDDAVREVNRCAMRVARDATALIQEA